MFVGAGEKLHVLSPSRKFKIIVQFIKIGSYYVITPSLSTERQSAPTPAINMTEPVITSLKFCTALVCDMKVHYVINNLASIVTCRRLERYFITAPHCCEMRFCNLHWLRYSFIANSHFVNDIVALTRCV